jgi:hypothetical protein
MSAHYLGKSTVRAVFVHTLDAARARGEVKKAMSGWGL